MQISETFQSMLRIGTSKNEDKHKGLTHRYIYSWQTYHTYMQQCCEFAKWCKEVPVRADIGRKPRTLEECRLYVEDYLNYGITRGLSPYTLKLQVAALAKLYKCSSDVFDIKTPS